MDKSKQNTNIPENFIIWDVYYREPPSWLQSLGGLSPYEFLDLSEFIWWRATKWVWIEAEVVRKNVSTLKWEVEKKFGNKVKFLVPAFGTHGPKSYKPHKENPSLFLEIINLEDTVESIEEFVSQWGPFSPRSQTITPANLELISAAGIHTIPKDGLPILSGIPEPDSIGFSDFELTLSSLKEVLKIYKVIGQKDLQKLKTILSEKGVDDFTKGIVHVAENYISAVLNHYFRWGHGYTIALVRDRKEQFFLSTIPHILSVFLVLQFAHALTKRKTYKPCEICGKPMETTPDKRTHRKKVCGPACAMRKSRLKAAGKK
ncbi:MAG: hypothetical protein IIB64_05995 [Proteobacteria bacterium]|nr:hypothetical protein [Pseudomonadota bacterium]